MSTALPLPISPRYAGQAGSDPAAIIYEHIKLRYQTECAQLVAKRNTVICSQGTKPPGLYLIEEGEIMLSRLSSDGRETVIALLGPGDIFGESSLLNGTSVTFSATATRRSQLLLLPHRIFRSMLDDPRLCRILLEAMARQCNDAWTQLEVLGCTRVRDKVRSGLAMLSERIGVETYEGVRIDINQTQLARMVGCAREAVSREVSKLKRKHTIDVRKGNGRQILVLVHSQK
ncbi:MAG TPA: Crp/Fnr family transcriptional regulator [Acidobacteriota bacterium]|nr:Crp/Fnr family transcriptional regulator [Acidobacteriota bacterium]